jgi:hypothetical protein
MVVPMPRKPASEFRPFFLRLSPDEHDALKAAAAEDQRTMAGTMRWALYRYLREREERR